MEYHNRTINIKHTYSRQRRSRVSSDVYEQGKLYALLNCACFKWSERIIKKSIKGGRKKATAANTADSLYVNDIFMAAFSVLLQLTVFITNNWSECRGQAELREFSIWRFWRLQCAKQTLVGICFRCETCEWILRCLCYNFGNKIQIKGNKQKKILSIRDL